MPPGSGPRPSFPAPPDFGGEDYGDGDKNIEDIFGGPQEQLSTAASGHAKPSKPPFGGSAEKDDKPPFDNDFGGSFDDTVGGRPGSTSGPTFGGTSPRPPFNGGSGPQKPSFIDDEDLQGGLLPRPTTTRRPFGQAPSRPSFLDEDSGFGARPGDGKPSFPDDSFFPTPSKPSKPFGGDDGFGTTGGATGPAAPDEEFMDDLFKPSRPTPGITGKPSKPSRPQDFGGFGVRPPSTTRPPLFQDIPKPFDEGGGDDAGDDFELFGGSDKGSTARPGTGRPTFPGGSKEDMNYGFFDGPKGPAVRPPQRPPPGGSKDDGFDFFGDKGPRPGGSPTSRPGGSTSGGFDFFGDKGPRPGSSSPSRPTGTGGGAFDFFGDKGPRPGPGGGPTSRPTGTGGGAFDFFGEKEPRPGSSPTSRPTGGGGGGAGGGGGGGVGGGGGGSGFDFFGDKGPRPGGSPTSQPTGDGAGESFDFFDDDKRPPQRPGAGGSKDEFDFFGNDKGSTPRPFRPTPSATKPDDDYSFDSKQPTITSRPPYVTTQREEGEIGGPINVQTSYDGKVTILTNIGDKHISFPPGVAVRAHVQSIDFLPYGSRIPSPSEQLKSESSNEIRKTTQIKRNIQSFDSESESESESQSESEQESNEDNEIQQTDTEFRYHVSRDNERQQKFDRRSSIFTAKIKRQPMKENDND